MLQLTEESKQFAKKLVSQPPIDLKQSINKLVHRIELNANSISIKVKIAGLIEEIATGGTNSFSSLTADVMGSIKAPLQLKKRGVETKLIIGNNPKTVAEPNEALITLIAQAHHWLDRLTTGSIPSIIELAREEQVDKNKISRALRFAFMAPDITQAVMEGHQPVELTADRLRRLPELPMDWQDQRKLLGFA